MPDGAGTMSILLVDDDPDVIALLHAVLSGLGHDISRASDGAEAIERLRTRRFDLVITDVDMPRVSGLDVLHAIKDTGLDTDVLLVSGFGSIKVAVEAMRHGAANYLEKPVNPEQLKAEVRAILARRIKKPRPIMIGAPKKLGRYRVDALLGRGGMGEVYRCTDDLLGRSVAVKTIHPELLEGERREVIVARFQREAQAGARLSHPNIVAVYEFGEDEASGVLYMATELVEGQTLTQLLQQHGRFELRSAVSIIFQVADALAHAHQRGVVHRDVKPGNVILELSGRAKLMDFGIASMGSSSLTQAGTMVGSPSYLSPERVGGAEASALSDQFALAGLAINVLTARPAFPGDDAHTVMRAVVSVPPLTLAQAGIEAPRELQYVLDRLFAKKADDRYPDERMLLSDLRAVGGKMGLDLRPATFA